MAKNSKKEKEKEEKKVKKLEREIDYLKILLENQKFLLDHIKTKYFFIFSFILSMIIILLGIISIISNYQEALDISLEGIIIIVFLFLIIEHISFMFFIIFKTYRKERGSIVDHHTHKLNEIREKYKELGIYPLDLDKLNP